MRSAAERKAAERARRAKEGLKRFEAWLHPEDHPKARRYTDRLAKRRERK